MSGSGIATLIVICTAIVPCVVLGYLIIVKQKRNLIAGWDESKIFSPQEFASIVGWSLIVLAFFLTAVIVLWGMGSISESEFAFYLFVVSTIPLVGVVYARRKYVK